MFSNKSCNYLKLRTNLRLTINRLKLLEKKKTELALKARKEIADYISNAKEDRARIRVEHIVREDYLVEAMEIIEMFCDLLLARFGLIEKMKEMDPGIEEAIATVLWASPRLSADVPEIREIQKQLTNKYSKEYADMCLKNGFENVNEKVMHKMSISAPPKILIENYMIEIARTYKVPFEADPIVMLDEPPEVSDLINLEMMGSNRGASGTVGQESYDNAENEKKRPPSPPGWHSGAGGGSSGGGGGGGGLPVVHPTHHHNPGAAYYPPQDPGPVPPYEPPGAGSAFSLGMSHGLPPPLPSQPPNAGGGSSGPHVNHPESLPPYDSVAGLPEPPSQPDAPYPAPRNLGPPKPARGMSPLPDLPDVPGLPSVPSSTIGASSAGGDDVDFDDLTKRFEDLKRRK